MHRQKATFPIAAGEVQLIKDRMLDWVKPFSIFLFLDNNGYPNIYGRYECLLAAGAAAYIDGSGGDPLAGIFSWHQKHNDWLFGHLCYDFKNRLEPKLSSRHTRRLGFPELHFFCPEIVCYIETETNALTIESHTVAPEDIFRQISSMPPSWQAELPALSFIPRIGQERYLSTIEKLREHIAAGDCYEINFCNEGYCEDAEVVPQEVFRRLCALSPAPYAAFYRLEERYLMCASPERYLLRAGSKVLSQPIKGTARRDPDARTDSEIREQLRNSIKDRAENVMIVDLVRNDLARSCVTGSIGVDELFGIYTFPQVHQMISTVSGRLAEVPFTDVIRYSFPMGSMTGAPKIRVMELIEDYESSARELYSGTVGYIRPDGDFDFNVVIRSLFYNTVSNYLCYQAGGAITYDSDAGQEWHEMRLKAWAMERIFSRQARS